MPTSQATRRNAIRIEASADRVLRELERMHGMNEFHLRLPATSANLGPGFDALALALKLYLYD